MLQVNMKKEENIYYNNILFDIYILYYKKYLNELKKILLIKILLF